MAESKFRIWAKAIAILELVLTSLAIVWLIVLEAGLVLFRELFIRPIFMDPVFNGVRDPTLAITIVSVIAIIIVIGVKTRHLWLSYNLLKAATIGTEPDEALRRANRWRISAIVMLVVSLLCFLGIPFWGVNIVDLLLIIVFIYVVHRYIKDLEVTERKNSRPPQNSQMA